MNNRHEIITILCGMCGRCESRECAAIRGIDTHLARAQYDAAQDAIVLVVRKDGSAQKLLDRLHKKTGYGKD